MKIVHAHWSLCTGGTETMMIDIMNEQAKDHEVWCLIVNDRINPEILNSLSPKVHFKCYKRKGGIGGYLALLKFNFDLARISPDIIHVHGEEFARIIMIRKAPIVLTRHSTLGNGKYLKLVNHVCFISEAVRQHSLKQGFDGTVVYNGIHTEAINEKQESKRCNTTFKIIQVGRLDKLKGQQILLEAASKLRESGFDGFQIDFIGDGDEMDNLKKQISELRLNEYANLLGQKSREYIYEHLCNYDLFVQPSLSEGFGLTIAEAMSAKVPVVTSDLPGPMEVIGNGEYGYYFQTGNSQSLFEVLNKILSDKLPDKTVKAKEFCENNFSVISTARNYLKLYQAIINHNA